MLDEGIDLVIKPPAEALDQMLDVVREMHTTSGLLDELAGGVTLAEAQDQVLAYVRGHVAEPRKVPLCGNSIATDRSFLARDMPDLDAYLHYRMVDVSSIKELARRWYPRAYFASPPKHGGHRALADITESIQELRYYREAVFVPPPGPDSRDRAEDRCPPRRGDQDGGKPPAGRLIRGRGCAAQGRADAGRGGANGFGPLTGCRYASSSRWRGGRSSVG